MMLVPQTKVSFQGNTYYARMLQLQSRVMLSKSRFETIAISAYDMLSNTTRLSSSFFNGENNNVIF